MTIEALTLFVNNVFLLLFVATVGAGLFGILRRVILYRRAQESIPVLMRRDIALLGSFIVIGLESAILRGAGIDLMEYPVARLVFILQSDIILMLGIGYWVKVELWDVDDPSKR